MEEVVGAVEYKQQIQGWPGGKGGHGQKENLAAQGGSKLAGEVAGE